MLYVKKLLRDLRAQKGQAVAVMAVTALGVMLFVASAGAYRSLRDSYAVTRTRLALARVHIDMTAVTAADVAKIRGIAGVGTADARIVIEVPVSRDNESETRATLRILSIPQSGQPALDRLFMISGTLPADGEVMLEKHFAQHHQLHAGAELSVGSGQRKLRVSGVAVSPEYLWVARDANDFMPSPDQFGVGWMGRESLRTLAADLFEHAQGLATPALRVAASSDVGTQLLIQPIPTADIGSVIEHVRSALGDSRVLAVTKSEDLVGVKLMQMDVDGYREMAAFFPVFFLGVGAFIVGSVLARLVDAQRSIIGTLMALGVGRATVLGHYLSFALVLGGVSSIIGGLLGLVLAPWMTHAYAAELNIPFVESRLYLDLLAWGFTMGLVVAFAAGLIPALRATRLSPAAAMRLARPTVGWLVRAVRSLRLPIPISMALRDVLARPMRSLGTALGVTAAVVLVLSTGAMLDSMKMTFSSLFDSARNYDVRVNFAAPIVQDAALAKARALPGVLNAEAALVIPAIIKAEGNHIDVMLQALPADAQLLRSVDANGAARPPGPRGITLTRSEARKLQVVAGSNVVVKLSPEGTEVVLHVTGFADAAMGNTANVRDLDVATVWHLTDQATSLLVKTDASATPKVRNELAKAFPSAIRVENASQTRTQFVKLMGLGWVMLGAMLVFGCVLAAAILFNMATLTILERQRELATLRALGLTMREVTAALTLQHALIALVGLGLGLPLAVGTAKLTLRGFSNDLFALPFVLSPVTVAVTLIGVASVVLLAQWPALRRVSRASLAEAVGVRDG